MAMGEREIFLQVLGIILIAISSNIIVQGRGCNNTTQGPFKCKCPCAPSRTSKCYLPRNEKKDVEPLCICREGHQGIYCNQCQNGWYQNGNFSDPKHFCIPCNCSNNLNLRQRNSCDPITGKCLHCKPPTMGERCHLCAQGYHGDAVGAHNCTTLGSRYTSAQQGKKHVNKEVIIIATCSAIGVVCLVAIVYLLYHRYKTRGVKGRIPKFWTVELSNRNYNDLDFSLLDSVSDTPFVYRNDTNDFEEALIADEGSKARLKIDMDTSFAENFDTSF